MALISQNVKHLINITIRIKTRYSSAIIASIPIYFHCNFAKSIPTTKENSWPHYLAGLKLEFRMLAIELTINDRCSTRPNYSRRPVFSSLHIHWGCLCTNIWRPADAQCDANPTSSLNAQGLFVCKSINKYLLFHWLLIWVLLQILLCDCCSGSRLLAPRMFCDICDMFDLHETDDCPRQAMLSTSPPTSHHHGSRSDHRPYCTTCEGLYAYRVSKF